MRYEGCLLSEAESRALIDELDRWCRRTGTNYNKLVTAAQVAPTTRSLVKRRGRRITFVVAARLRRAMQAHGKGISRDDYRQIAKPWRREEAKIGAAQLAEIERVDRRACGRCGTLSDKHEQFGCSRFL